MKIAISAKSDNLKETVDTRFGRAQGFVIYDTATKTAKYHSNEQNLNAAQGAGIQTAQNVSTLNADAVISGHCGPKAFQVLQAADIKIYTVANGTVIEDAIKQLEDGKLQVAGGADVQGHW